MKVSIDFDGTLSRKNVQKYAKELIESGIDVWITTARFEKEEDYTEEFCNKYNIISVKEDHKELFTIASSLSIKKENIHFTNRELKYRYLRNKGFIWHLDDDWQELIAIKNNTNETGILVFGNSHWKDKCNKLLKLAEDV